MRGPTRRRCCVYPSLGAEGGPTPAWGLDRRALGRGESVAGKAEPRCCGLLAGARAADPGGRTFFTNTLGIPHPSRWTLPPQRKRTASLVLGPRPSHGTDVLQLWATGSSQETLSGPLVTRQGWCRPPDASLSHVSGNEGWQLAFPSRAGPLAHRALLPPTPGSGAVPMHSGACPVTFVTFESLCSGFPLQRPRLGPRSPNSGDGDKCFPSRKAARRRRLLPEGRGRPAAPGCVSLTHKLCHSGLLPLHLALTVENVVVLHLCRLDVHDTLAPVCGRTVHTSGRSHVALRKEALTRVQLSRPPGLHALRAPPQVPPHWPEPLHTGSCRSLGLWGWKRLGRGELSPYP